MTVPIQIPIVSTSPPATIPVKPAVKPEKAGTFDQILKQKTCESIPEGGGSDQSEQVVKNQPNNNIQAEEKPAKEDTKPEIQNEEASVVNDSKDEPKADNTTLPIPYDVLAQTAAMPVVNTAPVSVETKGQTSDETGESGVEAVKATPLAETGSSKTDDSGPFAAIAPIHGTSSAGQASKSSAGDRTEGIQENLKESQPVKNSVPFSKAKIDPSIPDNPEQQVIVNGHENSIPDGPFVQKIVETAKEASGQSIQNVPTGSSTPEQAVQVNAANQPNESEDLNADENGEITLKASGKPTFTSDLNSDSLKDAKVDVGVQNSQNAGKVDLKSSPASQAPVDDQIKSIKSDSKLESKLDSQPPPEAPESASPTSLSGVVQERIKMDPFTGKINEPARLAEAQTTEILRQISRQVAGTSGTGSQSIRIQLHPEDLGQIDLRISTSPLGTHVMLIPDQSSTGKLLETHIAELKQTLADAGVQMANVHVGQQSQQQSFHDAQYGQNTARQNSGYTPTAHPGVEENPGARSLSRTSLVDYRI